MDLAILAALWGSLFNTVAPQEPIVQAEIKQEEYTVAKDYIVEVTGYSSRKEETDVTPYETASGSIVYWGSVASNTYSFGTQLRFPNMFGDKIFVVRDRMNSRYKNRLDIWFPHYAQARRFGIKDLRVEVLKEKASIIIAER